MPGDAARPVRRRVTHPRTDGVRVPVRQLYAREIDEQTHLGEVYVTALLRTQRRHAAATCAATAAVLLTFAALASSLAHVHVVGVPLPWLVLAVLGYPLLIGLGWLSVRVAERVERDFADVVRRR